MCFLPPVPQGTLHSSSNMHIRPAFSGCPWTHVVHKHLTNGPLLPSKRLMANSGFPPQMPLSQDPFLHSPGWFTNGWFAILGASPGEIQNGPLYMEGKERMKKDAHLFRLEGVRFNKQGNLHMRLAARRLDLHTPLVILVYPYLFIIIFFSIICLKF